MELARIVAMCLVILVHTQFATFGIPDAFNSRNVLHIILQSASIIGVDFFVLLSGYFSIKLKFDSLINIFYMCLFYGTILNVIDFFVYDVNIRKLFVVSASNWFIPFYIGLMLVSPILNSYIDKVSKQDFKRLLISLLIFEIYFGYLPGSYAVGITLFNHGCTVFHFVILYLLARYYRLFGISFFAKVNPWLGYIVCTTIIAAMSGFLLYLGMSKSIINMPFDSHSPFVILSALFFLAGFEKLNIKQSTIINRLAVSCLSVLIVHTNGFCRSLLLDFYNIIEQYDSVSYLIALILSIPLVYVIVALFDELRIRSFNYFKSAIHYKSKVL